MSERSPLIVLVGLRSDGATYALHPLSTRRLKGEFPEAVPVPAVFVGYERRADFKDRHGPLWGRSIELLTGVSVAQLHQLGAVIIESPTTQETFEVAA